MRTQAVLADGMAALASDYPAWHMWRGLTRSGCQHGWNATLRRGTGPVLPGVLPRVSALTPDGLRALLEQ